MPEETIPAVVPEPAAAPSPKPEPKPQAPATKVEAAPQAPPILDPDMLIEWPDETGAMHRMTIKEMADKAAKSGPDVDPDLLKRAELLKKMQSGDTAATREFVQQFMPPDEPAKPKPGTAEHEIEQLRQHINKLESRLENVGATTDQIAETRNTQMLNMVVKQQAEHVPHLAKMANAADEVRPFLAMMTQQAEASGMNVKQPQVQLQILSAAMAQAEQRVAGIAKVFGGGVKPASGAVTAADDQRRPEDQVVPAGIQFLPDGRMVDQRGRLVTQTPQRTVVPVSGDIPPTPIGGQPPGTGSPDAVRKPLTENEFLASIRARAAQLRGTEQ